MSTRRQVADAAGVSVRTVSNVVNGFEHIAPATRERVLDAIKRLGYRPSELARSLKVGRSGLVGLMLPELDTAYFAELTRAFVQQGASLGLTVVVDQTDGDPERERRFVNRTARGALFDALVLSPLALDESDVESLATSGPVIFLGEDSFPAFDKVMIDNRAAARDAVAHLIAGGSRRIAAIGAELHEHGSSTQRLSGYRDALTEAGMTFDSELLPKVTGFRRQAGADAMRQLMRLPELPDAVFCFSDSLALGALRALHERNIRVPGQIAVVGFDDIEDGRFSTPSLTSISPDKAWIASTAFDRIVRRLAGEKLTPATLVGPYELTVRESSRPPADRAGALN